MELVSISDKKGIPKYKQIVASVEDAVVSGILKKGDKLPSLNNIKNQHSLSRDTVLMAFNELKTRGIIQSVVGKGFYVTSEDIDVVKKIFLLFDELNSFKEDLYNSFLSNLGSNIQVDIFFHHFNSDVFSKLIYDNLGDYSYYVIMPANLTNTELVIDKLPKEKVFILDQTHEKLANYPSIYQNFKKNVFDGLKEAMPLVSKYKKIVLTFSSTKQPQQILSGLKLFCVQNGMDHEVIDTLQNRTPKKGELFFVLDDKNLVRIIKKIKDEGLLLGKDVGILSYNDTLLKEIVEGGITTISTDFSLMGKRLAQMVLNEEHIQVENPNNLIIRKSL